MSLINIRQSLFFTLFFFVQSNFLMAQKSAWKRLSKPEKCWVFAHPFVAYKTFKTTQFVLNTLKDKSIISALDSFSIGGKLDAFRHIFWMASVTQKIGKHKALQLGNAHERGNFSQFKKGKLEDGSLPDYASSKMDSLNNLIGAEIGTKWRKAKVIPATNEIINYINNGTAYIIKRNDDGHFVDCSNNEIKKNYAKKEWKNNKCVILISDIKK